MKILAFFILVGLSSASVQKLDDATEQFVIGFLEGVQSTSPLLGYPALYAEDDIQTELGRKLKDGLDRVLEKIKEAVDAGREVRKDLVDELKTLHQKLRDIKVDIGEKSRETLEYLKEQARDYLKKVLEKLGLNRAESDINTELGQKLKDGLDRVLEKIKEAVDEGRVVQKELVDELKTLRQKLRDIKVDIGERSREILQDLKERARDYLKKILEKFGLNKRASELTFQDMLRKVREHIRNTVDPELLKEKITKIFNQGSQILDLFLRTLKEKGRRRLEILIDTLLNDDEDEDRESRSIKEYWEKIKDYFKDLKIDLQEKYMKFGEWIKEFLDKGMEKSKDKFDNIRAIAKEFLRHAKNASKEVGSEALDFFQQYKKELGNIWDELKDAVQQIRNRED